MSNLDLTIAEIMHGDTPVIKIMKGDKQKWPYVQPLPYDAQVEYIEGGIFETDFVPSGTDLHQVKFMMKQKVNYLYAYTVYPMESGKWLAFFGWWIDGNGTNLLYGSTAKGGGKTMAVNTVYTGEADFRNATKVLKLNGSNIISQSITSITNTYPLAIQLSREGTTGWRFYYYKCYTNDNLVADIIPVRVGSAGALYDKVSGSLYTMTAGSGTCIIGNDVTT